MFLLDKKTTEDRCKKHQKLIFGFIDRFDIKIDQIIYKLCC